MLRLKRMIWGKLGSGKRAYYNFVGKAKLWLLGVDFFQVSFEGPLNLFCSPKTHVFLGASFSANCRVEVSGEGVLNLGGGVKVENDVSMIVGPKGRLIVGEGVFIGSHCLLESFDRIEIGKGSLIAPYVFMIDSDHGTKLGLPIQGQEGVHKPITIGRGVWIGEGAKILKGVTIGDGAVVGAGSVVTKNVPDYYVVAGNPAEYVRVRR